MLADMDLDPATLEPDEIRPLRRVEFDTLVELGVFVDEPVELLYGVLVTMSPQGREHTIAIRRLTKLLILALVDRADVGPQLPFAASADSEPQPDVAVYPAGSDERDDHPDRALLIVEAANTSLRKDRVLKARLYAEARVPDYWVIDVNAEAIEVFRSPRAGSYRKVQRYGRGEAISLLKFPDITLRVDDILAPRR